MVADRQPLLVDLTGAIGRIQHPDILADLTGVGVGRRRDGQRVFGVARVRLDVFAPMSRGECLKSIHNGRSAFVTGTALPAPLRPLDQVGSNGSVGWIADIR